MECQLGALGLLADQIDEGMDFIQQKIQMVQNKINQIPAMIDAELAAKVALIQAEIEKQFPIITDLKQLDLSLPDEIKNLVAFAQDAAAFANEVELLKDKYEDAGLDLLKDPANVSNLLRDLQGDLNRLCDLVPTVVINDEGNVEIRGRGNTEIEVLSRPNIDVKSLLTKEGRAIAIKQVKDSLKSIEVSFIDNGTGNISKESQNRYGW
jgi:hypothetical protein